MDAVTNDKPVETGAVDDLIPVLMAKATTEACRANGKFVEVEKP